MKTQFYLLSFLILLSLNLSAVTTNSTIEKTRIENVVTVKKTVNIFFQNMIQRVLKKKITERLGKKLLKVNDDKKTNLGVLSVMFSILGLIFMSLSFKSIIVTGVLFGFLGLIFGIREFVINNLSLQFGWF
ncbi:MAG: hypothetical protein ACI85O_002648 [Saprospiraceae bacterium]|jgi:hypothetical protein